MPSPRPRAKKPPASRQTITHQLRSLIEASGLTPYEIGRRAGLESGIIRRFLKWERSLTLDSIDQLADALGFRLAETARGKTRPKGRSHAVTEECTGTTPPVPPAETPPCAAQADASKLFEESLQADASKLFEVATVDQPTPAASTPAECPEAMTSPLAEPAETLDEASESDPPWWEQLVWQSGTSADS